MVTPIPSLQKVMLPRHYEHLDADARHSAAQKAQSHCRATTRQRPCKPGRGFWCSISAAIAIMPYQYGRQPGKWDNEPLRFDTSVRLGVPNRHSLHN